VNPLGAVLSVDHRGGLERKDLSAALLGERAEKVHAIKVQWGIHVPSLRCGSV
jgi:hypothetical protein